MNGTRSTSASHCHIVERCAYPYELLVTLKCISTSLAAVELGHCPDTIPHRQKQDQDDWKPLPPLTVIRNEATHAVVPPWLQPRLHRALHNADAQAAA